MLHNGSDTYGPPPKNDIISKKMQNDRLGQLTALHFINDIFEAHHITGLFSGPVIGHSKPRYMIGSSENEKNHKSSNYRTNSVLTQ
jgi:hypothetical protein